MSDIGLKWIESAGGPLILMGRQLVDKWQGFRTDDYRRACCISEFAGTLLHCCHDALVLGDEPLATTVLPGKAGSLLLARWIYGPGLEVVEPLLLAMAEGPASGVTIEVNFGSCQCLLFDAACPGEIVENENSLRIELPHPTCHVYTEFWQPQPDIRLLIHKIDVMP